MLNRFQDFISHLIYEKNWYFIHFIISTLCDIEMGIKLLFDKDFKEHLDSCNIKVIDDKYFPYEYNIPKNTFYCEDCPYRTRSHIATFLLGNQSNGYCYYINNGDYRFINPTDLLWDGCKSCDIDDYIIEKIEDKIEEINGEEI